MSKMIFLTLWLNTKSLNSLAIDNKKVREIEEIEIETETINQREDIEVGEEGVAGMIIEVIDKKKTISLAKRKKKTMKETIDDKFYLIILISLTSFAFLLHFLLRCVIKAHIKLVFLHIFSFILIQHIALLRLFLVSNLNVFHIKHLI